MGKRGWVWAIFRETQILPDSYIFFQKSYKTIIFSPKEVRIPSQTFSQYYHLWELHNRILKDTDYFFRDFMGQYNLVLV